MGTEYKSISVVMATYNGERFLREQLDSILSQTYPITEFIIQDDFSTDSTRKILKDYASEHKVIHLYFNSENIGFKRNFSSACEKAECEYVALADQDDIWLPNHIEILVNLIEDKGMACCDALIVNTDNQSLNCTLSKINDFHRIPLESRKFAYRILFWTGFLQGSSMMLHRDLLEKAIPIPDGINYHDVWFSALASLTSGINYSDEIITRYRRHANNVSLLAGHSIFYELKRHTHFDFIEDRVRLCECLRSVGINDIILDEFEQYSQKCNRYKYRMWCLLFRFKYHYKDIYTSCSIFDRLLRSIHFLLTPSSICK